MEIQDFDSAYVRVKETYVCRKHKLVSGRQEADDEQHVVALALDA